MDSEDFYILHLSDLHIRNESSNRSTAIIYSNSLKELIKDIELQTRGKENIIIVISGDIIDQGRYDLYKSTVLKFFQDLSEKIKSRVCNVVIVPGNHDKSRNKIDSLVSMSHMESGIKKSKESETAELEWSFHQQAYSNFLDLCNEICRIFGKEKNRRNTYCIDYVVIGKYKICFLLFDSTWCSYSENDYRKLRIGEYQLADLCDEYKIVKEQSENEGFPVSLTIAVSHYPLNWLTPEEEQLCNNYFLSEKGLDVDILMCGHVHDFSVLNHFNHTHSLLTLVTGIGWGSNEPVDKEVHRYSIYHLNLFYNACDIVMRKIADRKFDYDYSIYTGETEFNDKKLRYPLKVKESNAFIRIDAPLANESKSLFIDTNLLNQIPKVSKVIASFTDNVVRLYSRYKQVFLLDIEQKVSLTDNQKEQLHQYFYEDGELSEDVKNICFHTPISNTIFSGFLAEICSSVVEAFIESFSEEVILRAHFRWHRESDDNYIKLCQYNNSISDEQQTDQMQSVQWGGLIKPAFEAKSPMVFSANRNYNSINTSWDDFITIVPRFYGSTYDIRKGKRHTASRPLITFGISLKNLSSDADKSFLYILAFLKFDKVLEDLIDEFVRIFDISTPNFIAHMKKMWDNSDKEEYNNE